MKHVVLLAALLFISGCCSYRHLPNTDIIRDSVRVEIKDTTIYSTDTVYIELPAQSAERATRDSLSHLETDYAISDARIEDGILFHSLRNKARSFPVTVPRIKDIHSEVYSTSNRKETIRQIPVPRELTFFQKLQIKGFWAVLAVLVFLRRKSIIKVLSKLVRL